MDTYYRALDTFEDWEKHKSFVLGKAGKEYELIERAIEIVQKYHDKPRTLYKGTYNRHPLRVARILLEEFSVTNPKTVLIALCHDLGEWTDYEIPNLKKEFGDDVFTGVEALTWKEGETWDAFFYNVVKMNDRDLLKVKLADKLDNNRGAAFSSNITEKEKARNKTEKVVRPFIEEHFPEYWAKFEESLEKL